MLWLPLIGKKRSPQCQGRGVERTFLITAGRTRVTSKKVKGREKAPIDCKRRGIGIASLAFDVTLA